MKVYAPSSIYYLLFGTLKMPLFGTVVSNAPTSRVSLVLALVVSFGTLALKSIEIAKVALVLNQSIHSATPRSYFDRTGATLPRGTSIDGATAHPAGLGLVPASRARHRLLMMPSVASSQRALSIVPCRLTLAAPVLLRTPDGAPPEDRGAWH